MQTMLSLMIQSASEAQSKMVAMMASIFDKSSDLAQKSASSLTDIAGKVAHSKNQVSELTSTMEDLDTKAKSGESISQGLNQVLVEFRDNSNKLTVIQNQMTSIQEKADSINSVGKDAEMLALNAAIEAARAGESGRGFAVVADSMKSLAKSSQEMSGEIQSVLAESNREITDITESLRARSEALLNQTEQLVASYDDITGFIGEIDNQVKELRTEFEETLGVVKQETDHTRTAMEDLIREFTVRANERSGFSISDIEPKEAHSRLKEFDFLIDVRRPEEYDDELGHIPGTKLITLQTDFAQAVKTLPKDKKYLFICRSGGRSTKAAQQALLNQITNVSNLDGGMLAWRKAGL